MDKNYLTYPVKNMKITQSYLGSYSHAKNYNGRPYDYPIDEACLDSSREYMYCPCDCMVVKYIYGVNAKGTNTIWLESTEKVVMPCGTDYVTIMVIHPMDDDLSKLKVGQKFYRGDKMFREGTDGNATGNHFHISVGKGKYRNGWVQNNKGAWPIDTVSGAIKPEQAFFVDKSFTNVIKTSGLTFTELPKITYPVGDVTKDGKITAADARLILRAAAGTTVFDDELKRLADLNGDGKITAADAREALRIAAGLE